MEKRVQNNGLKWFTPNGAQETFSKEVGDCGDVFVGIFSAANGVGKTALMVNMLGAVMFEHDNPYFRYPIFDNFPFPHRGRIASSTKNVEEIGAIQTEIKRWFPKGKYQTRRNGKRYDSEYIVDDWVVDVMTYDQDVEQYESATLGLMIFDEPPPTKILNACIARMRKGGMIWIFMTPLDEGGEILEDLTEKEELEYKGEVIGRVYVQYAEIEENCKEHGIRGQLDHKDIITMLSFYDDDEKDARAKGKPTHLIGRIYQDFVNADPYVVDDFVISEDWYRVLIVDPHDAIPYAMTWIAIDEMHQPWIYDEFPNEPLDKMRSTNLTTLDYSRIITEKEGRNKVDLRIIDPFFGNKRYSNTGQTVKEELWNVGLVFDDGDTSGIEVGHQKVREYLRYNKSYPLCATNHPKLHVMSRCKNHIRSFLRYKRKQVRSGEVKDKVVIDETYKHFMDNVRHLLMRRDFDGLVKDNSMYEPHSYR